MKKTPQQEEVQRLKARYQNLLTNPNFQDNIKILHSALADRIMSNE